VREALFFAYNPRQREAALISSEEIQDKKRQQKPKTTTTTKTNKTIDAVSAHY